MSTREELLEVVRARYGKSTREEKGRILDEFVKITGYHRKHVLRLVLAQADVADRRRRVVRKVYDEAVRQALIVMWEAADRICGKRLKAALPILVESMERHGHLVLDMRVKEQVLRVSAATIDRLLASVRGESRRRVHRRLVSRTVVGRVIPIRTHADWKDPALGFFEGDFVLHGGGSSSGSFAHTLVLTEVASGWTDFLALPAREQSLVVAALGVMHARLPMGYNQVCKLENRHCRRAATAWTPSECGKLPDHALPDKITFSRFGVGRCGFMVTAQRTSLWQARRGTPASLRELAMRLFLGLVSVPIDNNKSERMLRVLARGRASYLFVGTDDAGQNLAILMSLVLTAEACGINPQAYIADVLLRIQDCPAARIDELLPQNWKPVAESVSADSA